MGVVRWEEAQDERRKTFQTDIKARSETYIILVQVWMVSLNAIVEDGYDDSFSCVPLLPCGSNVHVETVFGAAILKRIYRDIDES